MVKSVPWCTADHGGNLQLTLPNEFRQEHQYEINSLLTNLKVKSYQHGDDLK